MILCELRIFSFKIFLFQILSLLKTENVVNVENNKSYTLYICIHIYVLKHEFYIYSLPSYLGWILKKYTPLVSR